MSSKPRELYEARAKVAKALAHPSRLIILDALAEKEMCVCELTDLVGADQSTVSKHLAVLKNAGIVADRRNGVMIHYSLKVGCLRGFWTCVEGVLKQNLKEQQALLEPS
jgi:ArsR family transcriptional regulator, arsenate/arsenite/antimonite-responsive transcriptional repressor